MCSGFTNSDLGFVRFNSCKSISSWQTISALQHAANRLTSNKKAWLPAHAFNNGFHHFGIPYAFVFQQVVVDVNDLLFIGVPEMVLIH